MSGCGFDEVKMASQQEAFRLKVLSWNIDGLNDEQYLDIRTLAVINIIESYSPHIVYLQEVVSETIDMIQAKLGTDYTIHTNGETPSATYFPVILVTKNCPKISLNGKLNVYEFPGTTMGRRLLELHIQVCSTIPLVLYNTHLESLSDFSRKRKSQLKMCFDTVFEQSSMFGRSCVFGGDLNISDSEINDVGIPITCRDVWEMCGSSEEHRYTSDSIVNDNGSRRFQKKCAKRIDRLYVSLPTETKVLLNPDTFELIGKERIPSCNCYPSDHWGIFTVINLL